MSSFISSSKEIEIPYGLKVQTKHGNVPYKSTTFGLDPDGNQVVTIKGDLVVEGATRFTQGNLIFSGSSDQVQQSVIDQISHSYATASLSRSFGGHYDPSEDLDVLGQHNPIFITPTNNIDRNNYSFFLQSGAGDINFGINPDQVHNLIKPYIMVDSGSYFNLFLPMILDASASLYEVTEPLNRQTFFSYPRLTRQPASGSRPAGALPVSLDRRAIYDFGNPTLNEQYVKTKEENRERGGTVHGYSIVGSSIFHTDTTITDDYVTLTSSAEYQPYIRLDKPKENIGVVKNVSHTIGDQTYFGRIDEDKKEIYMVFPSGTTGTQTLVYETSSDYVLDNAGLVAPTAMDDDQVSLDPSFNVREINFNSGSEDVVYTITSIASSTDNQNIDYSARLSDPFLFDYTISGQNYIKNERSFFDASENIDSYSEILTKNVLEESLNNIFIFKPNFQPSFDANSSSSADLEILPQYSAKLDEEQLYNTWITGSASLQSNEHTNPTSSYSYDYLKIKYANFDNFKAHYEASSSIYNIHNDPIKFSQVNLDNLDTPSFENLFYIDSGKRYTFSFENAPNPSADVMDELDAILWKQNVDHNQEDETKPAITPNDYPGWTRHIYVKIIKRGTGTSIKGQVSDSSGYIPLLDSIKQDKRIDGITTIKDVCLGDPSFIIGGPINFENLRDAFDDPYDTLPSVDDFWKNSQQAIKALDFVVNPSIKDLAEISFKIDYSAAFTKTIPIDLQHPNYPNETYTKGYTFEQAESRYMFIRFAVSRISDLSITDLVDLDAGAPLAKSVLITSGSVDQNGNPTMNYYPRVVNNEISIDEHGDAKVTYKTFKNNYKDTSAFADYMSSNNFVSGQQLIYLANPKTPVPPGDVGEIYAIKVSDFVSEFGAAAGGSVIANFKSFDVGRVGGSFVSIEPEQSIDTLTIQSDNDVIRLVGDSLTDTITLKFDGADVKNDGDLQELLQQPRMALFPADSSGNIANKVRPADSQEIQFFRKLNNIPDFITTRPPDSTGLLTQFSSGSYYSSIINNTASLVIPNAGSTTFTASFEVPSGFDVLVGGSIQTSGETGRDFSGDVTYIIQTASLGGVVPSDTEIPGYPSLQVTSPGPAEGSLLAFKFSDAVNAGFTDTYYARISQNTASILVPYNELNFANIVSSYEMSGDDTEWSAFIKRPVEVVQPTNLSSFYIPSGSILTITGSSSDAEQNPDDGYSIEFTSEPAVVTIVGTPNIDGQPAIDGPFEIKLGRYENTILFDASSHTLANVSASIAAGVSYDSDNRTNQIRIDGDNLIVESIVAGRDGYISSSYGIQQGSGNVLNSTEVTQDEIVTLINDEFDTSYVTSSIESGKISIRTINESRDATLRVKYDSLGIQYASPVFSSDSGVIQQASQVSEVTANDYTQDLYYTFVSGSVEEEYRVRVLIAEEYTVKTTQAATDNLRHSSALMIGGVADGINQLNHIASGSALHLGGYSIANVYPDTFDPKYYGISFGDNKARIYESSSVGSVVVSERLGVDQEFTADQEKYSIHSKLGIKIENSGSIEGVEVSGKSAKITLSGSARLEDADLYVNDNAFVSGTLDVSSSVTAYNGILSKDGLVVSGSTSLTGSTLLDGPTTLKEEVIIPNTTIVRNSGSNYVSGSTFYQHGELKIGTLLASQVGLNDVNEFDFSVDDFSTDANGPYQYHDRRADTVNGYEPLVLVLDHLGKIRVSKRKLSDPTRFEIDPNTATLQFPRFEGSIPYYGSDQTKDLNSSTQFKYVTSSLSDSDDRVTLSYPLTPPQNEKFLVLTEIQNQYAAKLSSVSGSGLSIISGRNVGLEINHTSGSGITVASLTGSGAEISANNGTALELSSSESPIKFSSIIPTSDYFPVGKSRDVLMASGSMLSKVPEGILVSREVDRSLVPMATETVTSSSPVVTEFMFTASINQDITADVAYSVINGQTREIKVIYPYGSDITKLTASFTLEAGYTAEINSVPQTSNVTGNDFTNPVTYTFTSSSVTEQYVVTLTEQEHYGPSQNKNWVNLEEDTVIAKKLFAGEMSASFATASLDYDLYVRSESDDLKIKLETLKVVSRKDEDLGLTNTVVSDLEGNIYRLTGSSATSDVFHYDKSQTINETREIEDSTLGTDTVVPNFELNTSNAATNLATTVSRDWTRSPLSSRYQPSSFGPGTEKDVFGIFHKSRAALDLGDGEGVDTKLLDYFADSDETFRRFVFEDNISNVHRNYVRFTTSTSLEPGSDVLERTGLVTNGLVDPTAQDTNMVGRVWAFEGEDDTVLLSSLPDAKNDIVALRTFFTGSQSDMTTSPSYYLMQSSSPFQDKLLRFEETSFDLFPEQDKKVNLIFSEEKQTVVDQDVLAVLNTLQNYNFTGSYYESQPDASTKYRTINSDTSETGISTSNYVSTHKLTANKQYYLEAYNFPLVPTGSGFTDFLIEFTGKIQLDASSENYEAEILTQYFSYETNAQGDLLPNTTEKQNLTIKAIYDPSDIVGIPRMGITYQGDDGSNAVVSTIFGHTVNSNQVYFDGIWHHYSIAFERDPSPADSGKIKVYVDGELKGTEDVNKITGIDTTSAGNQVTIVGKFLTMSTAEAETHQSNPAVYSFEIERIVSRADLSEYSSNRNQVGYNREVIVDKGFSYVTGSEQYYLAFSRNSGKIEDAVENTNPSIIAKHISGELFREPNLIDPIASNPPETSNNTRVATTKWVRDFMSVDGSNNKITKISYTDNTAGELRTYNSVKVDDAIRFKSGEFIDISGLNALDDPSGFELTFSLNKNPLSLGSVGKTTGQSVVSQEITDIFFQDKYFSVATGSQGQSADKKIFIDFNSEIKSDLKTNTDLYELIPEITEETIDINGSSQTVNKLSYSGNSNNFSVPDAMTGSFLQDTGQVQNHTANSSILNVNVARRLIDEAVSTNGTAAKILGSGVVFNPITQQNEVVVTDIAASQVVFDYDNGLGFDLTHDQNTKVATVKMPNYPAGLNIDGTSVEASASELCFVNDVDSAITLSGSKFDPADLKENKVELLSELKKRFHNGETYIYPDNNKFYVAKNFTNLVTDALATVMVPAAGFNGPPLRVAKEQSFYLDFDILNNGIEMNVDAESSTTKNYDFKIKLEDIESISITNNGDINRVGILTGSYVDNLSTPWREGYSDDYIPGIFLGEDTFLKGNLFYSSHYVTSSQLPPAEHHIGMIAYVSGNVDDPMHDTLVFSNSGSWSAFKSTLNAQTDVNLDHEVEPIPDNSALVWSTDSWVTSSMMYMANNDVPAASIASSASLLWDSTNSKWVPRLATLQDLGNVADFTNPSVWPAGLNDGDVLQYSAANQRFEPAQGGGGSGNANFILSSSVPSSDEYSTGSFWYDTDDHVLYARVADINDTEAWLEINTGGNASPWVLSQDRVILQNSAYKVGIATATFNPNAKFQVEGAYCDGNTWSDASSRELKEDIEEINSNDAFAILDNLEPVSFRYKDKERTSFGFIAEDVPDVMTTANKDSLSPMQFVGVLTKVVKDQNEKLAEQSKKIDFLTEALEKLLQEKGE